MRLVLLLLAFTLAGCASAPVQSPERLVFNGHLDLAGIGVIASHESGLLCEARSARSRLPETVTLQAKCNDEQSATLTVNKGADVRGVLVFARGREGDVAFELPAPPRVAVVAAPASTLRPVPGAARTYVRPGAGSMRFAGWCWIPLAKWQVR
jgi:hypothetical protein